MAETVKIVFPTDFSEASLAGLDWTRRMAEKLDAEIHCVTCIHSPVILQPAVGPVYPTIEDLRGDAEFRLNQFVDEHLAGLSHPVRKLILTGRPADEIVSYAKDVGAEMIIMATHGRSGLAHIVIGSTTENVVRNASCSVLSIRA